MKRYTSDITNPFYKSALKNKQKPDKVDKEKAAESHEHEPSLDEIKDIEKMEDDYFHRDDT